MTWLLNRIRAYVIVKQITHSRWLALWVAMSLWVLLAASSAGQ